MTSNKKPEQIVWEIYSIESSSLVDIWEKGSSDVL
jgi:hypothetical protein